MLTTDGLVRVYRDSSNVSIPLIAAIAEFGETVFEVVGGLAPVADKVTTFCFVHPDKVIASVRSAVKINKLLFILITPGSTLLLVIRSLDMNLSSFNPFYYYTKCLYSIFFY